MDAEQIDADFAEFLHLLRDLVREPSVVGLEDYFFRIILRELEALGVRVNSYYGLVVAEGQEPDRFYISAHVDRHGLLCTGPNEFQYAAFIAANRGELTGDSVSEQFMETVAGRFRGQRVQAHTPFVGAYLGQGVIGESYVCPRRKNLIFEIEGLAHLLPGTPVAFLDRLTVIDGMASAQLDNVVSVAMLIELMRRGFQGTVLFTAGEEAGKSWRYLVEWFQRRDVATNRLLVLDTSPFPTVDEMRQQEVVLRNRDANAVFDETLTTELSKACQELGFRCCFKDEYVSRLNVGRDKPLSLGRTELGRVIQATGGRVTGTTLQLPTSAYHTARETTMLWSMRAMLALLEYVTLPPVER
ncbi:MAG: peptidase M42 [Pirellulaceae bacterium]|nr:MAG: peptidase M42 [Pirellulaceae bacterium]